jgi:hypothetical protein
MINFQFNLIKENLVILEVSKITVVGVTPKVVFEFSTATFVRKKNKHIRD